MKTFLVVYESEYGNTKQIADAILNGIVDVAEEGDECRLVHVQEADANALSSADLLVMGCPTQKFTMMPSTKRLVSSLSKNALRDTCIAAFDTRITEAEFAQHGRIMKVLPAVFGYAAEPLSKRLRKHGGTEIASPEGFYVNGTEGPLLEGEVDRAEQWGRTLAESFGTSQN